MNYSRFIEQFALAVQNHEGFFKGSNSYVHNNPGNLRSHGQFVYFPNYFLGFSALEADIFVKCTNKSASMTAYYQRNYKSFGTAVFQDVFNVYAPSADGNSPNLYCLAICEALKNYNVTPQTSMLQISNLAEGFWPNIPVADNPAPSQPVTVDPPEVVRYLQRLIANTTNLVVRTRLIQRLLTYRQEHSL